MLRKILVILDDSSPGRAALGYAMHLAQKHKAILTGLTVIDTPWITASQPEAIGTTAFKEHRDETVIKLHKKRNRELQKHVQELCRQEHLSYEHLQAEGFPALEISEIALNHDIVIMGNTTDFHFELDDDSDIIVRHIARGNPRPLITVPAFPLREGDILYAHDGGTQATRALHLFCLLGFAQGRNMTILTLHEDPKLALSLPHQVMQLCQAHGATPSPMTEPLTRSPSDAILDIVDRKKYAMLIMGASSKSMLRESLFGSTTQRILQKSPIPVFLSS